MAKNVLVIQTDGTCSAERLPPRAHTLRFLQGHVDGLVEAVTLWDRDNADPVTPNSPWGNAVATMWINEEGKAFFDKNSIATEIAEAHGGISWADYIAGPVVITTDDSGDCAPLSLDVAMSAGCARIPDHVLELL